MNDASLKWRIPLVAAVIALCFFLVYPPFDPDGSGPEEGKLKLGLDLQGGMHLVLRVKTETLPEAQRSDAAERALEIIRNRIDQFGVSEPLIQRQGKDRLVIQLPGIADRERALALIGKTALLEFKLVADRQNDQEGEGVRLYPSQDGSSLLVEEKTLIEGKTLKDASVQYSGTWGEPVVSVSFDNVGSRQFSDVTSRYVGRRLAIVLDGVVQSAPVINEPILSGEAQISGSFKLEEASDLAITLRAGALPAPIVVEEERTVGPSLGRDSIRQGVEATLLAGALVVVFMAVYYLFSGIIADIALAINILIIGACLAYFKGTLTVPGIAGIILTIGMAVDTNVLILERVREELGLGKSVAAAIAAGYKKAFTAIFDTHITTLLTAVILFYFGTGPIRGFALTMVIGLVASFFSAIFCTRLIYDTMGAVRPFKKLSMLPLFKKTPTVPYMKYRKFFFGLSAVFVLAGLFVIFTQVKSHLGIDFTGGTFQEFSFSEKVDSAKIREALSSVGLESATIQDAGQEKNVIIRTPQGLGNQVTQVLQQNFAQYKPELLRMEEVGPIVGKELRGKALLAIFGSLLIMLVYLSFRFQFIYSLGTITALFHDAVVSLALLLLMGREVSIPVLAAVLTIVGYSANDTVVIFDRVRENLRKGSDKKESYEALVNRSLNESMARTILTSLTVFIVVVTLYFFGGPVINDFAYVMMVGVVAGTYSTIFVSCPIIIDWANKKKKF